MRPQNSFLRDVEETPLEKLPKRSGPPNRMNDLAYKDWMKFQKSFFRFTTTQSLVEECIYFFTKSTWNDGRVSTSLILGATDFDSSSISSPRIIETPASEPSEYQHELIQASEAGKIYDFILI